MNEAELLFSETLNCSRTSLYLERKQRLDKRHTATIAAALKRRISREPIDYILGKTEFMGLEFKVTPDVLIPRQETEILVETALKVIRSQEPGARSYNILELGTGSGCIAIALVKSLLQAKISATDISPKALKVAKANAVLNQVDKKIKFIHSDLFTSYELQVANYDMVIFNPPYIPSLEIAELPAEIQYEPHLALDGGTDGLDFYRRIINSSARYLKEGGYLILEMGVNQAGTIKNIFSKQKKFAIIEVVKDYLEIDRVIVAQRIN